MRLIISLFSAQPYLDFPFNLLGWIGWFVLIGIIIFSLIRTKRADWLSQPIRWGIFTGLVIFVPLTSLFFGVRFSPENALTVPGMPIDPIGPILMFFSAIPWMLAAGFLGIGAATLLAAFSGLCIALWGTHSIFTILEYAGMALLFSVFVRQQYRTNTYRLLRHPIFAALATSFLFLPIFIITSFFATNGSLASRLDYSITQSYSVMLARMGELILSGIVVEVIYLFGKKIWYRSAVLVPSPMETNLQLRFFYGTAPLVLLLILTLVIGDWLFAGRSAEQMIQNRLSSSADVAAQSLPYFLETGQNLVMNLATPELLTMDPDQVNQLLAQRLRSIPYFRQISLVDENGKGLNGYPIANVDLINLSREEKAGIQLALKGVPFQTYTIEPWPGQASAQVSFLAAVYDQVGQPRGVLIGRTDLASNSFTQPAIVSLESLKDLNGEGAIIDENHRILYHSNQGLVMRNYIGVIPENAQFIEEVSSQGTRQLAYYQPVNGRPWTIILTVPAESAQQLSLNIAVPLLIMLVIISIIALIALRFGLRAVTSSLRGLAQEATLISQGQLDNTLKINGEDELGQFGRAFEKMRSSLKARLEELNSLLRVSQGVAENLDVESAVKPILQAALTENACMARIVLVRDVTIENVAVPYVEYGYGPGAEVYRYLDQQLFDGLQHQAILSVPNAMRTRRLTFPTGKPVPGALIALAIRNENVYYGVLWVAYDEPHVFIDEDVRFLGTLVGQAALAATNSKLYATAEIGRQRLEAVLASTPEPVLVIDKQMKLYLLNPAALQVPGLIASASPGRAIEDVILQPELIALVNLPTDEGVTSREITMPNGRIYYASISPVLVEARSVGKVCIMRDITYYKELDTLKSDFVSTVSHDLRSPLTLMRGYATMLQMVGELNDQQKSYIAKMVTGVENMSRLVNNLLDLGRIEAGIGLQIEELSVSTIVDEVINLLTPQANQKNIKIRRKFEDKAESPKVLIQADAALLQQAVYNLVENAIKYTPVAGGDVSIDVLVGQTGVVFEVRDMGIGIAPLDLPHMFEKFYRSGRREAYQQRGTGLGLAIVKSIAERHRGRVWVESQLGKGSTFSIEVPYRQP